MDRTGVLTVLPIAYGGDIGYWARLLGGPCTIDVHENWVKQSMRNRQSIISASGVTTLSVNVCGRGARMLTRDVRIDYSKRWQHQHWISLVSAYRNSPYFDFYEEFFEPFYSRRFDFLLDFDLQYMQTILKILGRDFSPVLSESYIPASEDIADFRGKRAATLPDTAFEPYTQVFSDRMPFAPNLSILDLIFSEGPDAAAYIERLGGYLL